ncbi:MAG TPA: NmrA family NAD(P)-binding protein [Candidatus Nitrosocosmicus sp.]|nr:NmrA family NAD(P)-binding protein [Candidatus Nitrosocosmicus sp.]
MTLLVTGATGRVGKQLVKILSLYDKKFYISLRSINCSFPLVRQRVEAFRNLGITNFIDMDYNNLTSITHHKLEGIEKIFLITPYFNLLDATRKIVTEAQKTKSVKHIVNLSDMGVELNPSTYAATIHNQIENIIKDSGFHYTFLRPNYYMQNFIEFIYKYRTNEKFLCLPLKNSRVSFVDLRDVAEVAAVILHDKSNKHYNKVYDITGGQRLNCSEVAGILETLLGEPIKYVNISEQKARTELLKAELKLEFVEYLLDFYRFMREGRMRHISKVVETILGRKPISFEIFVRDHAELFKSGIELKVNSQ